jgi:hypothetical protein
VSTLPPGGWYDDPENPGQLRYWDGTEWSDRRAPKPLPPPPVPRQGFKDISDWLSETFKTLAVCRVAMLVYFAGTALLSLIFGLAAIELWGDLRYVDGNWAGFSAGRVVATVGLILGLAVAGLLLYLFATHQLHHGHHGAPPRIDASLAAAARAMPRTIRWALLIGLGYVVVVIVMVILFAIAPVLGVLGLLAGTVGIVWLSVKLAFFIVACVAPAEGLNPIESSFEVSTGRFFPSLGRVLLAGVIGFGISIALNTAITPLTSTPDPQVIESLIVVENDDLLFMDVGGILEEVNLIGPSAIVSSIAGVVSTLVSLSAMTSLYGQIHRPRKDEG